MNSSNYAVIMAGGVGSRFWPRSTQELPKQFLDMLGSGQTLIQKTFERLSRVVHKENIFILTNEHYIELVKAQLPAITDHQIIPEPTMRNTAPCILLSALKIQKEDENSSIIIAPSDHWIEDEEAFAKDIETAFKASREKELLMTLGIRPSFPNTGYGYIKYDSEESGRVKTVLKFTEKPDYPTAKSFIEAGNFLWNAGIFIGKTKVLTQAFENFLPEMHALFNQGHSHLNTEREAEFIKEHYPKAENISMDYGIMEKAENVSVLPASFDWSDLGTWGSLYKHMKKDEDQNVLINAQTHLENARHNLIESSRDRIIVVKDLQDYIIVDDKDILLIYPMDKEQDIKQTRNAVMEKFEK